MTTVTTYGYDKKVEQALDTIDELGNQVYWALIDAPIPVSVLACAPFNLAHAIVEKVAPIKVLEVKEF